MLHELFHARSAAIIPNVFSANKGWEEGPVERLMRLTAPEVLPLAGVPFPVEAMQERIAVWRYKAYLPPLLAVEEVAMLDNMVQFYLDLLRTPAQNRRTTLSFAFAKQRNVAAMEAVGAADIILTRDLGVLRPL